MLGEEEVCLCWHAILSGKEKQHPRHLGRGRLAVGCQLAYRCRFDGLVSRAGELPSFIRIKHINVNRYDGPHKTQKPLEAECREITIIIW